MSASRKPRPFELPIFTIRGQRVILDADLARIYGVTTKRFNEALKRNPDRFPEDFAFQLTRQEFEFLRSHIAISSSQDIDVQHNPDMWSQSATTYPQPLEHQNDRNMWSQSVITSGNRRRRTTFRPWAFTEHGALMAANILRSERAVQMSVYVIRAFVKQREHLSANAAILKRLAEIDKTLLEHDGALRTIWAQLQPLLAPPPERPKPRIGFQAIHG